MTAEPLHHEPDPEDPVEILRILPKPWHPQFHTEYQAAATAAVHDIARWRQMRDLLHRWRLRALAYSHPEFIRSAHQAAHARPEDLTPLPGWQDRR